MKYVKLRYAPRAGAFGLGTGVYLNIQICLKRPGRARVEAQLDTGCVSTA
jgi:hypothetical protein